MQNQNGAAKTSASAKIFLLLSDGKWHTNDELYALNRRPSSIIFNLKARGVILEKKKDLEVRFLEHWRIVPGSAPAKLRLENGFIRSETGGISKEKAEGKPAEVKPVQSQVPPIPLQKLEEVSEPPRENELPQWVEAVYVPPQPKKGIIPKREPVREEDYDETDEDDADPETGDRNGTDEDDVPAEEGKAPMKARIIR